MTTKTTYLSSRLAVQGCCCMVLVGIAAARCEGTHVDSVAEIRVVMTVVDDNGDPVEGVGVVVVEKGGLIGDNASMLGYTDGNGKLDTKVYYLWGREKFPWSSPESTSLPRDGGFRLELQKEGYEDMPQPVELADVTGVQGEYRADLGELVISKAND